jgi:hypothetical protein
MKKIIVFAAGCIFALNAFAQQGSVLAPSQSNSQWKDTYCASAKDGHTIVMNGKNELVVDITLQNGTKITTDGDIIKQDGSKVTLQSGQCVDKEGNIVQDKKPNGKK